MSGLSESGDGYIRDQAGPQCWMERENTKEDDWVGEFCGQEKTCWKGNSQESTGMIPSQLKNPQIVNMLQELPIS